MRPFGLVVFLIICLMLAGGGYYAYRTHNAQLEISEAKSHAQIAQGFAATVWKMHRYRMQPLLAAQAPLAEDNMDVALFAADAAAYFSGMRIPAVQVYGPNRQLIAAFPDSAKSVPPTQDLFARALLGKAVASRMLTNGYEKMVVQSLTPVTQGDNVELLVAVITDVSPAGLSFVAVLAAVLGSAMLSMLFILVFSAVKLRRSETVLARQFEENADLMAQAAMAKEENQQKSQFLANITHELRTPLNAIIGFSDILKNEFVPAAGQGNHTNYISDIHSAGTHLLSLINDILDYSKAEAGKLELEVTDVNITKMIQNCMRLVQPRAEIAQVKLIELLPKDSITMTLDGKKFKQIMLNLLSNAVKFTHPGGTVKVSAWNDMQNYLWKFEVRDSGIGIAPKDISRAMSPFGQVDNALSRKFEGTGLGLPLTKKFVELMGGKFEIESEEGKGTAVSFSLPERFVAKDGVVVKQVA